MRSWKLLAMMVVVAGGVASSAAYAGDASDAFAQPVWQTCQPDAVRASLWQVNWIAPAERVQPAAMRWRISAAVAAQDQAAQEQAGRSDQSRPRPRTVAFEYSDAYKVRAKIHTLASIPTLPLFVAEYLVGQNLYTHPGTASDSARGAHGALAASTAVLFGINTVTGVWNLIEASKDPNHRAKRTIHGILMIIADAGFVATGATASESEHGRISGSRSTHRAIALTSMGVATVSYLMMLFGGN
ncbi:MAG: hypothetical protein WCP29_10045 [Acidobacteriota bacterium]